MKSVAYYSEFIPDNNISRSDRYLAVNCTGHAVYPYAPTAHTVRRDYYLIYLTDGTIRFQKPHHDAPLSPGECIILSAHKPFEYTATSPSVDYYWVHFSGREAASILESLHLPLDTPFVLGKKESFLDDFLALFLAFSDKSPLAEDLRASALLTVLTDFAKTRLKSDEKNPKAAALVSRSAAYIHEHISEPLTVSELAAREYLSDGRYRELFRRVIGMSPQEYLLRLRINIACDLLHNTALPIAEIALSVGCPDARYFSRLFMKRMGMTPSDYRKQHL
ncbi:MAG: helix-turn-helix domain-containing protein [Clostridia bacterium]|nr:helix-turn-helix domain-containing protein [Clostridia bacterium]